MVIKLSMIKKNVTIMEKMSIRYIIGEQENKNIF